MGLRPAGRGGAPSAVVTVGGGVGVADALTTGDDGTGASDVTVALDVTGGRGPEVGGTSGRHASGDIETVTTKGAAQRRDMG